VFPDLQGDALLGNVVMLALLKRTKRRDVSVHGFRSSFRDWAAEQTNFPREVAEAALAHAIQSRVGRQTLTVLPAASSLVSLRSFAETEHAQVAFADSAILISKATAACAASPLRASFAGPKR